MVIAGIPVYARHSTYSAPFVKFIIAASSHAGCHLQDGLVHGTSNPSCLDDSPYAEKLGGKNKVVEIDETYVGGKETNKYESKRTPSRQGGGGKAPVLALVERDGSVRSERVANVSTRNLKPIIEKHVDKATY